MPAESANGREREARNLEARGVGLAAAIDRLWDDLRGGEGDGDAANDGESMAVIDAVVEPPSGASQSTVEAAVAGVEDDGGPDQTRESDDNLSI